MKTTDSGEVKMSLTKDPFAGYNIAPMTVGEWIIVHRTFCIPY